MFGYVKVDLPNLYVKDTILYKSMYCGLCKGIGKKCGQRGRIALSYDLTFLSLLLHNVMGIDVEIKRSHCIIHTIRKRPIAKYDELTGKIAMLNIILSHYKVVDDIIDSNKGRLKKAYLARAYKRAKRKMPEIDKIVNDRYNELRAIEQTNSASVDMVADPFAKMLTECVKEIAGAKANKSLLELSYSLGKYIYLIDALDDFDKDKRKKQFNVFVNYYPKIKNKRQLIDNHRNEITFIFANELDTIAYRGKQLDYKFNHDLIDNVLYLGLKQTLKDIMENKKCKKTTKS